MHQIADWGALAFGVMVGWITYRTLMRTSGAQISDIATVVGAVGGAAVIKLYNSEHPLGLYAIGLFAGFFTYFLLFWKFNGSRKSPSVWAKGRRIRRRSAAECRLISPPLDVAAIRAQIAARDGQLENAFTKDSQIMAIRNARRYIGDRLARTAPPHAILDPANGPLVAVKLHILTRKTLGGIQTDLQSRALAADGSPIDGLYAAGEVAGFGGGGVHGYNALEGTFLGGCLFSGRAAGGDAVERLGG